MNFVPVHILLLFVHLSDDVDTFLLFIVKLRILLLEKYINVAKISSDVFQLFLDRLPDLLRTSSFALCKAQISVPRFDAVHPRSAIVVFIANRIDDGFEILSCFIQQIYVLWIRYLLRCTVTQV